MLIGTMEPYTYCFVGLVVKASTLRVEDLGFESRLRQEFSGSSYTSDLKIDAPVVTLPGVWRHRVSAGMVGPVSVYCDWVRQNVWSATSISVWQHIKLSEQMRPWDTLACCCGVKQATTSSYTLYTAFSGLHLGWGSQGQQKAKPVGFVFWNCDLRVMHAGCSLDSVTPLSGDMNCKAFSVRIWFSVCMYRGLFVGSSNMLVHLGHGSAQIVVCAAALRKTLTWYVV